MLFKVILKKYKFIKLKKLLKPERFQEFFTIGKVIIQRKVLGNEEFPKWNPYCHDFCFEKAKAALPPHCLVRSIDGIHFRRGE